MDSSPAIDSHPVVQELQRIQGEVYRLRKQRAEQQPPLPALVRKMILLFNGARTLEHVCELCGISIGKGRAVAHKLERRGILERLTTSRDAAVQPAPQGAPDKAPADFSWEEEAFFATELPPIDECDLPFETLGSRVKKALRKIRRR